LSVVIIKAEYSGVEVGTFFIPGEIIFPYFKKNPISEYSGSSELRTEDASVQRFLRLS
jgi:hypothetical protein